MLLAVLGTAIAASVGGSTSGGTPPARLSLSPPGPQTPATAPSPTPPSAPLPRSGPSPGSLPQTHAYPSGNSAQFKSLMASLWAGITKDSLVAALPAFFPRGAYVQLKAIGSAGSDWRHRLVHDYALDIAAAHALLGRNALAAELVRVAVRSSYGHWIPPGVCYNEIGYYELPNARVVYRESHQIRSFGIASMISWRGVWYVVHLGAILRSSESGVVDEPTSGPGVSAYSGTC